MNELYVPHKIRKIQRSIDVSHSCADTGELARNWILMEPGEATDDGAWNPTEGRWDSGHSTVCDSKRAVRSLNSRNESLYVYLSDTIFNASDSLENDLETKPTIWKYYEDINLRYFLRRLGYLGSKPSNIDTTDTDRYSTYNTTNKNSFWNDSMYLGIEELDWKRMLNEDPCKWHYKEAHSKVWHLIAGSSSSSMSCHETKQVFSL